MTALLGRDDTSFGILWTYRAFFVPIFLILLFPSIVDGQDVEEEGPWNWLLTGWIGGATEQFEERLPMSPQLAVRIEARGQEFGAGLEASTRFVSERLSCPAEVGRDCDATGMAPRPILSVAASYHVRSGEVLHPYIIALGGINVSSSSPVLGVGIGANVIRALADRSIYGEIRYRRDNRFGSLRQDHWEFMVGLDLQP